MAMPSWKGFARDIGVVLVILFILWALSSTAKAAAPSEYIATWPDGSTVTITQEPCSIKSPWFAKWKRAYYVWRGAKVEACWAGSGDAVFTIDAAGEIGHIPVRAFKPITSS